MLDKKELEKKRGEPAILGDVIAIASGIIVVVPDHRPLCRLHHALRGPRLRCRDSAAQWQSKGYRSCDQILEGGKNVSKKRETNKKEMSEKKRKRYVNITLNEQKKESGWYAKLLIVLALMG